MKFLNKEQEIWLDEVFSRQRMFYTEEWCETKPIKYEASRWDILFSNSSIFNLHDITKEKTQHILESSQYEGKHRRIISRIELINEILHDRMCNPIMVSYRRVKGKIKPNIHPGRSRAACYAFLRMKAPALIHLKKSDFETDIFPFEVRELKKKEELFDLFKPKPVSYSYDKKDLIYSFRFEKFDLDKGKVNERHDVADCDILKIYDITLPNQKRSLDRGDLREYGDKMASKLAKLLNHTINVFTNSKIDVEDYFNTIEDNMFEHLKNRIQFKKFSKNFKINYCEQVPQNFGKSKGFSIWFDKDVLDINYRHLYEFLFFYYEKNASTKDRKIQVINFENKQVKDLITIHEQFYRRDLK